jgi:hypothetical protein
MPSVSKFSSCTILCTFQNICFSFVLKSTFFNFYKFIGKYYYIKKIPNEYYKGQFFGVGVSVIRGCLDPFSPMTKVWSD